MARSGTIRQIINSDEKESICRLILSDIPEWLRHGENINDYAAACRAIPFWADAEDDEVRGFISLRETSPCAAEIFAMGVRSDYQRRKVGKGLFTAALNYARRQGYEYIQVKTVKQGISAEYDSLNIFYQSLGFRQLEILPLWGSEIPCQIYIRNVNF